MTTGSLNVRYYKLYLHNDNLGPTEDCIDLDTTDTALLAVDVGGMGHSMMLEKENEVISEHILPAMNAARRVGIPVVYVNNSAPKIEIQRSELGKISERSHDLLWEEWGSEDTVDPKEYVYGNSKALKIPTLIEPQSKDYFLRKHSYSGFFDTRLDGLLRNLGIKTLICVGFSLDVCLHSTMIDAMNLNYQVVLLRDATLAQELPDDVEDLSFTKRLITLTEYAIGYTASSQSFISACSRISD